MRGNKRRKEEREERKGKRILIHCSRLSQTRVDSDRTNTLNMSKTATRKMINMLMPAIHIHTHLASNPTKHFALNPIAGAGYLFPLYYNRASAIPLF